MEWKNLKNYQGFNKKCKLGCVSPRYTKFMNTNNPDSPDEIICPCTGATRGQVEKLFYEGLDLDAISRSSRRAD